MKKINLFFSRFVIVATILSSIVLFCLVLTRPISGVDKTLTADQLTPISLKKPSAEVPIVAPPSFIEVVIKSVSIIPGGCANINVLVQLNISDTPVILRVYLCDKESVYREQKLSLLENCCLMFLALEVSLILHVRVS